VEAEVSVVSSVLGVPPNSKNKKMKKERGKFNG
jgi:hypothetical protein